MQEFLTGRFTLLAGLVVLAILGSMFLLLELGYRIGRRHREEGWRQGLGTLEGGVFGLMGLLLAFTFSGAASRFDARRTLIVEEANDIGTAWLRIDLLPVDAQRAIRDSFRSYVDARIATYRAMPDYRVAMEHNARMEQLQGVIWQQATTATREGWVGPNLLLPALNAMFDITNSRKWATRAHPPGIVYVLLAVLVLMTSMLAGYAMSAAARRWSHIIAYVLMVSLTIWVILDLEYPRLGVIRVDDFDQAIVDVRASMK